MIKINNLSKRFGSQIIFDNVNLELSKSGIVFITGPSGSGKSTLMNMLAAYDLKYDGSIIVDESALKDSDSSLDEYRRSKIGFIFQNFNLISKYTVLENCLISIDQNDDNYNIKQEETIKLLKNLGLGDLIDQKVDILSGGEKQRVAMARALLHNPKLILADEPTGSLDSENKEIIMDYLRKIAMNKLVVMITHDESLITSEDTVLKIDNENISKVDGVKNEDSQPSNLKFSDTVNTKQTNLSRYSMKNFIIHAKQYALLGVFLSIALCSMLISNNSSRIMGKSIQEFKDKNISLNTGYIRVEDNEGEIMNILGNVEGISYVQKQYKIDGVTLIKGNNEVLMETYYPMSRVEEDLSFGMLPRRGKSEIAINPSLAQKLTDDVSTLIGETINVNGKDYTISGLFNAGYDSFYISQDLEPEFFDSGTNKELYAITYEVDDFNNIVKVNEEIVENKLVVSDASEQVKGFLDNFNNNTRLFNIVSMIITLVSVLISISLLFKVLNSRKREFGLLNALGFNKITISNLVLGEISIVAVFAVVFSIVAMLILNSIFSLSINFLIIIASLVVILIVAYILMRIILKRDPIQLIKS